MNPKAWSDTQNNATTDRTQRSDFISNGWLNHLRKQSAQSGMDHRPFDEIQGHFRSKSWIFDGRLN